MNFSIIVITFNRKNQLEACLKSIFEQEINYSFEVIIVHNGEPMDDGCLRERATRERRFSIEACSPSAARNRALLEAKGDYVLFLDDDCVLPSDYFLNVDFSSGWDVLGGPDQTPRDASATERLIGKVLESPFCMGPTFRRHTRSLEGLKRNATESDLILCNMWFKRGIFSEEGHCFKEDLYRCEENFLLKELKLKGKVMFYDPDLYVFHSRKKSFKSLALTMKKSGECRVRNYLKLFSKQEVIYFFPLLCVGFLLFSSWNSLLFSLVSYSATVFFYGMLRSKTYHLGFVFLHFLILSAYALGVFQQLLASLVQALRKKPENNVFLSSN